MKKLFLLVFGLMSITLIAQAPQGLNYQAIAWDNNNLPKQNKTLTVIFSILNGSATGPDEFYEIQTVTTNAQGLFTTTIGIKNSELFKKINWNTGTKFLQVIIDEVEMGTTQILSVPYALYAERTNLQAGEGIAVSGNTITNTGDRDNTNEIQMLGINGRQLSLSRGGGNVDLPKVVTAYGEEKNLQISISKGNKELFPQIIVPESGQYLVLISYDISYSLTSLPLTTSKIAGATYFQGNLIQDFSKESSDNKPSSNEVRYFNILGLTSGNTNIELQVTAETGGTVIITKTKVYLQKIN